MRLYTIKEITKIVDRTEPSIYALIRTDKEFFNSHREKTTKGGYKYDEEALERLKIHFGVSNVVGKGDFEGENDKIPKDTAPIYDENGDLSQEIASLSAELEEMKGKYAALQADFEKAEGERVELLRQNGLKTDEINHLLLLLSQEKAEKQALLPPPRKTIREKIKFLFTRKITPQEGV